MWKLATAGLITLCFVIGLASVGSAAPPSTLGSECPPFAASTSLAGQPAASLSRSKMPRVPSSELVACVGSIPIDGAMLDHWMRIAWLSSRSLRRHPKLRALDEPALSFLIQAQWITGEAAALGISLSEAEVHAQFVKLRRQQFPHKREFDAFLHSSGFTVSDLLLRVRVEMLPSRITQHVLAGRRGKQREHAMTEFVKRFKLAWVSRTYCAPALRIEICGHSLPAT
jgi:hypothetical protein